MIRDNYYIHEAHKWLLQWSAFIIGHSYMPEHDVVVITGGANGLGKALVQGFKERNARIAVLDISSLPELVGDPNIKFYYCDVSDVKQLTACHVKIKAELGTPTVLINNAGVAAGSSIMDMLYADIERTIKVNLILNFYTAKTFLPGMIELGRGYIVTIGSILGYMSPANYSAYGASKSGLLGFHESLTYELGPPLITPRGIKTLLVCPGQMQTDMFSGVQTPLRIFAPKLDIDSVAGKVIRAIEVGKRGEMRLPAYGIFIPLLRATPWPVAEFARVLSGMDHYAKQATLIEMRQEATPQDSPQVVTETQEVTYIDVSSSEPA
ncbi:hypothetical protein PUMCH_002783 [Australozyma saopauloensis]|uniref:NAD(P)-binding protein n=1 Tax=Australozyma saopauloensis TaxID=291208 RepID=A0AAX4HA69_9ASCO|nr:hypothetical protein PUMCH_002783 [[Candida] saopauloensis]